MSRRIRPDVSLVLGPEKAQSDSPVLEPKSSVETTVDGKTRLSNQAINDRLHEIASRTSNLDNPGTSATSSNVEILVRCTIVVTGIHALSMYPYYLIVVS